MVSEVIILLVVFFYRVFEYKEEECGFRSDRGDYQFEKDRRDIQGECFMEGKFRDSTQRIVRESGFNYIFDCCY